MIKIELLGGARKSFPNGVPDIKPDKLHNILDILCATVPSGAQKLELDLMLVALNGADSSTLDNPLVCDGDTLSIIPIVHGGQSGDVILVGLKKNATQNSTLLDSLRSEFPTLVIQLVRQSFILSIDHANKIINISLCALKRDKLLSQRLETDILMRFAGTSQISLAIKTAGMKNTEGAVLVIIGNKKRALVLQRKMYNSIRKIDGKKNSAFLRREFKINAAHIGATYSAHPLEDILVERALILT